MRHILMSVILLAMVFVPALAQNQPAASPAGSTDSQALRELLQEIRGLRHDLQTSNVAAQRIQIALYRLQLQDAVVARASKSAEEAHGRLTDIQSQRKQMASMLEQMQSASEKEQGRASAPAMVSDVSVEGGDGPTGMSFGGDRKTVLAAFKSQMDRLAKDESTWQQKAGEADAQLTQEQTKLESLHSVLDQLDEALQNLGRPDTARAKQ